ncbi:hypothetical protein BJX99DRAFT_257591 [Aspergillus californicus]
MPGHTYEAKLVTESQRFQLWASSLGLYHTGHSSLDYRFRDSPPLFEYAFTLLGDMLGALSTLMALANGDTTGPSGGTVTTVVTDGSTISDDSSEEDFSSYKVEPLENEYIAIVFITMDRLYALSFKIRNPAMRTGLSRALTYTQVDQESGVDLIASFRQWDLQYVVELLRPYFQDLEPNSYFLVPRLAKANTYRRQQFKYWENRKAKFNYHHTAAALQHHASAQPSVSAEPRPVPMSTGSHRGQLSEPSTATHLGPVTFADSETVVSTDSYAVVRPETADTFVFPPPPEINSDTKEFECPYCFIMCGRRTLAKAAWERHIIRDLRPYVCTVEDCKDPDQQYDTLTEWMSHESSMHGYQPSDLRECPICLDQATTAVHIASHMRRIAFFALPRFMGEDATAADEAGSMSRLSRGSSEADGASINSGFRGEWADSRKLVILVLPGDGEVTIRVGPDEATEDFFAHHLRGVFNLDAGTKLHFTDANRTAIEMNFDSLYSNMIVHVHIIHNRRQHRVEEHLHDSKDDYWERELKKERRSRQLRAPAMENTGRPARLASEQSRSSRDHHQNEEYEEYKELPTEASTRAAPFARAITTARSTYKHRSEDIDQQALANNTSRRYFALDSTTQTCTAGYHIQDASYFLPGKVFSLLLHDDKQPVNQRNLDGREPTLEISGEPSYRATRRMVVFKTYDQASWCLPIRTYNRQGVADPRIDASKHAVIYMAGSQPLISKSEPTLTKSPLELWPDPKGEGLDLMSRINFGTAQTVRHDVEILHVGEIAAHSMPRFIQYAQEELSV